MTEAERAQIRAEERLEDGNLLSTAAHQGVTTFGLGLGALGCLIGYEGTAQLLNSLPLNELTQGIKIDAMQVLDDPKSFRAAGDYLMNGVAWAVLGSGLGAIVGKIIDSIGRVRSRIHIPILDDESDEGSGNS